MQKLHQCTQRFAKPPSATTMRAQGTAFTTTSESPLQVVSVPQGAVTSRALPLVLGMLRLGGDASAPAPACSKDAERKAYEDRRQGDICWPLRPQQIGFSTRCLEGSRGKALGHCDRVRLTGGSQELGEERRAVRISFRWIKKAYKCFSLVFESLTQQNPCCLFLPEPQPGSSDKSLIFLYFSNSLVFLF